MSSPWKQLERRLPPLPGNSSQTIFSGNRGESLASSSPAASPPRGDYLNSQNSGNQSQGQGPILAAIPRPDNKMAHHSGILKTPQEIKQYLRENRWLVQEFVRENHSQAEVQTWFQDVPSGTSIKDRTDQKGSSSSFREGNLLCPQEGDDVKEFLVDMVERVEDQNNVPEVLYHLAQNISAAVKADEVFLFMIEIQSNSLYFCSDIDDCIQLIPFVPIISGTVLAAHVASSMQPVFTSDILGDERFPQGTGRDGSLVKSVICLPVIQPNGSIVAVIELSRYIKSPPFIDGDMQIASTYLTWVGIAIDKVQVCNGLMKQREFNDFLLEVSRVIFDDIVSIESLSKHIMMFAKSLVNADRCTLFMVDTENQELYADLFDDGLDEDGKPVFVKRNQIRFSMNKGIAGHVASTGEVVNVADAYQDARFNREVDVLTGYATRCVLCMPIISHGVVIGIVQLVNKMGADGQSTAFDHMDESNFMMFASYCALALHYSKIYSENHETGLRLAVVQEQLTHYTTCSDSQVDRLLHSWNTESYTLPPEFEKFEFHSRPYINSLCELFILMVHKLFGPTSFDLTTLARFVLTVRKNYRLIPFHNFCHAFDVAHCMFMILPMTGDMFTEMERQALFFSSICHDIDHRAKSNSYLQKFGTPLGCLYKTSTMEHHHSNTTKDIIHREGHNIFSHMPLNTYTELTEMIHGLIQSTDLVLFFGTYKELSKLMVAQTLDWDNPKHKSSVLSIFMTACDLCATTKTWPIQQEIVECLYEEFYAQGDEEKERGETPMPMTDRDNEPNQAQEQVTFLTNVCVPLFTTMTELVPGSAPLLAGCEDNLAQWTRELGGQSTAMWDVHASIVRKK